MREACLAVIRRIQPKDGITYAQAITDICELTEIDDLTKADIMGPMNAASKELRRDSEPGLRNRRGQGWERETPEQMVAAGEHHERKGKRQVKWAVEAVSGADIEALGWDARARAQGVLERHRRETELAQRKAQRKRPLASGE